MIAGGILQAFCSCNGQAVADHSVSSRRELHLYPFHRRHREKVGRVLFVYLVKLNGTGEDVPITVFHSTNKKAGERIEAPSPGCASDLLISDGPGLHWMLCVN